MKFTIFISYTSKDKPLVNALADKLNTLSDVLPSSVELKLWDMDVDCSGKWDDACKNALADSNVVISLLTDNVYETSYVHKEIDLAKKYCDKGELRFIPVALSSRPLRNDLTAYTNVFCTDGALSEKKLDEIYAKVESYANELVRLPYVCDVIERVSSRTTSKFFVGREDKFDEIKRLFDGGHRTVVLTGLGGIGKTELAKNFVLKYGAEYPNSFIVKVDVSDSDTTQTRNVKDLVRSIRFISTPVDTDNAELIYTQNLECLKSLDKKTILIIDGYDVNLDLVKDLWQIFDNLSCEVIFTSRQKSEKVPVVDVTELSDSDALQIFEKYCPAVSSQDALDIANGVDYHTLTLELAARLLGQSKLVTAQRLKSSVFDVKSRIPHDRDNKTATIMEHIENIFDLSNLSQFKQTVLAVLCRIASQGLSIDELIPLAHVDEENEYELAELVESGLVRYADKYSLHTVIAEVAFRKLCLNVDDELKLVRLLTDKVTINFDNTFAQINSLWEYGEYYVNKRLANRNDTEYLFAVANLCYETSATATIMAQYSLALNLKNKALKVQIDNDLHKEAAINCWSIGQVYSMTGEADSALEYFDKAEKELTLCGMLNSQEAADVYAGEATVYNLYKNDYEKARKLYQKTIDILSPMPAVRNYRVAQLYIQLGAFEQNTAQSDKDYMRALDLYNRALSIQIKLYGADHPLTSITYMQIGTCYLSLGKHEQAMELLKKSLDIQAAFYGENNLITAGSCVNLGANCYASGNNDEALKYYRRGLKIMLAIASENHLQLASVYYGIANVYNDEQQYESALEYAQKALDEQLKACKDDLSSALDNYLLVGQILQNMGKNEQASPYFEKGLDLADNVKGLLPAEKCEGYQTVAYAYYEAEKYEQACSCYNKALNVLLQNKIDDKETATSLLYNIALCHYNADDCDESLRYYAYALKNQMQIYGEQSSETEETAGDIEDLLSYAYFNEENDRIALINKYLVVLKNVLGDGSFFYLSFLNCAVDLLTSDDDLDLTDEATCDEIKKYSLQTVELSKKLYGEESSATAAAYYKTACVHAEINKYLNSLQYYCLSVKTLTTQTDETDADEVSEHLENISDGISEVLNNVVELDDDDEIEDIFAAAIEFAEKTLGKDSLYLEIFLSAAAYWYTDNCYYEEGLELYERAYTILTQNGDGGKKTADVCHNIGALYYNLKQYDKALEYARRALEILQKNNGDTADTECLIELTKNNMN